MLDTHAETIRSHFRFEQDVACTQRLTLQEKHYNTTDPAERDHLAVALADNRTDQDDLRIAMAIANGYTPDQLNRHGFTIGPAWVDITPTPAEQAIAYATPYQLAVEEYGGQDDRPHWAA